MFGVPSFRVRPRTTGLLQQQGLDSMGVNGTVARRPRKDREAAVLRGDQRYGAALIVDELRRGEMTRAAELPGVHPLGSAPFNRLGHDDLFDGRRAAPAGNLGAE